jgi:alginate O-acetyltransferase complex protein AlgI
MSFCSQTYLVFFLVVFAAYWLCPRANLRVYILLAASFFFYAYWNTWLACIVVATTCMDYVLARGIGAADPVLRRGRRRGLMVVSIVVNLGVLCYFKYVNFFLDSLNAVLKSTGAESSIPLLNVIVPFGISFYTFEAISYTVDVYRGRIRAERNLAHFMLFILFFPHLVAGPIVRARDFLPQVARPKAFSWLRFRWGLELFLLGLFKKMVIADRLAHYIDPVFANPDSATFGLAWLAAVGYSLQIYCDFSGYSDMAIGTARMFGYKLTWNFNLPYLARNVSEFWRRWHISLSTWLRDYLFIPLGGSRGGFWPTARNLMITMTLGGLWHGASWNFIVWGIAHGGLLIGHRIFAAWVAERPTVVALLATRSGHLGRIALTFLVVTLCWIFFRAQTFDSATTLLGKMFSFTRWKAPKEFSCHVIVFALLIGLGAWFCSSKRLRSAYQAAPGWLLGIVYAVALNLTLMFAGPVGQAFIYFQF